MKGRVHIENLADLDETPVDADQTGPLDESPNGYGQPNLFRPGSERASLRLRLDLALRTYGRIKPVAGGQTGGVYSVLKTPDVSPSSQGISPCKLAVFKPASEEGFGRRGISAGGGAAREEAAYMLDRQVGCAAGVPVTTCTQVPIATLGPSEQDENDEVVGEMTCKGSAQRFVPNVAGSAEDFGMPQDLPAAAAVIPTALVQQIAALDIRLCNTDRHTGNLLFQYSCAQGSSNCKESRYIPVPIDHGCVLPCWWAIGEANFEAWLGWPHLHVRCLPEVLEAVECAFVRRGEAVSWLADLSLEPAVQATYHIAVALLREGTVRHGLSLATVARLLARDQRKMEEPSWLELQMEQAANQLGIEWLWERNKFGDRVLAVPSDPKAWPADGLVEILEERFCSEMMLEAGHQLEQHGILG